MSLWDQLSADRERWYRETGLWVFPQQHLRDCCISGREIPDWCRRYLGKATKEMCGGVAPVTALEMVHQGLNAWQRMLAYQLDQLAVLDLLCGHTIKEVAERRFGRKDLGLQSDSERLRPVWDRIRRGCRLLNLPYDQIRDGKVRSIIDLS